MSPCRARIVEVPLMSSVADFAPTQQSRRPAEPLPGRRDLLAGLGLLLATAGCGRRAMGEDQGVIEIVTLPGEIDATPDLRLAAFTSWMDDFSAIGVCDLEARTVDVLHAQRKATLRQPALSRDGELLAFTAKPFAGGATSLYVAPIKGGSARRIGRSRNFAGPSFSSDAGQVLAFAGNLDDGPQQLVEIDLASGVEETVWSGAFVSGFRTAYDPQGSGFLVSSRGPAESLATASEGRSIDDDGKRGSPRSFRVPRGDGEALPMAAPRDIGEAADFRNVTADGDILVRSFSVEEGVRAILIGSQGQVRTVWHSSDLGTVPDGMAISANGKRLLTSRLLVTAAGESAGRYEVIIRDLGSQAVSRFVSTDFRSNLHPLRLD